MFVSIIVPAFNAEKTLAQCIEACLNQTHRETEVLVVDDGSTDSTPRIAESFPIRYIRQENAGPAAARNRGARASRAEILAFTDSDCVPQPDWIERLVSGFEDGVVGVGGTYGIANPESGLARVIHDEIAARHSRFGKQVDFLGSFNVAYRRDAFEAAGGFDEDFKMASGEDNDLAYRLGDTGGMLRFVPEAVVNHYHPTRLWPYLKTQMQHGSWRVKLYTKHRARMQRGDRYARPAELFAPLWPPLFLLVACLWPLLAALRWWVPLSMLSTIWGLWFSSHLYIVILVLKRAGNMRMIQAQALAMVRDCARSIGLLMGLWHFRFLRKVTVYYYPPESCSFAMTSLVSNGPPGHFERDHARTGAPKRERRLGSEAIQNPKSKIQNPGAAFCPVNPRVLIIIPAYNESDSIGAVLDALQTHVPECDVVVVDDGSRDSTSALVEQHHRVALVRLPYNLGIGAAMQTGYKYALREGYDIAVQCDADGQHPVDQIPRLVERLQRGDADLVVGSRYVADTEYRPTLSRRVGKSILSRLVDAVIGGGITDTTSGFRAANRKALALFARHYPDDYPEAEALVILHKSGLRAVEIPVDMKPRQAGATSIRLMNAAYYMVKVALAIFINVFRKFTKAPGDSQP